jgi:hypothetical protein
MRYNFYKLGDSVFDRAVSILSRKRLGSFLASIALISVGSTTRARQG